MYLTIFKTNFLRTILEHFFDVFDKGSLQLTISSNSNLPKNRKDSNPQRQKQPSLEQNEFLKKKKKNYAKSHPSFSFFHPLDKNFFPPTLLEVHLVQI